MPCNSSVGLTGGTCESKPVGPEAKLPRFIKTLAILLRLRPIERDIVALVQEPQDVGVVYLQNQHANRQSA